MKLPGKVIVMGQKDSGLAHQEHNSQQVHVSHNKWRRKGSANNVHQLSPFPFRYERWLTITCIISLTGLLLLSLADQVESNPVLKQGHSGGVPGSQPYYSQNKIIYDEPAASATSSLNNGNIKLEKVYSSPASAEHEQPLVKPSELSFKLNRYCQADVSLERVICHNVRRRGDLPKKEKYFDEVQQALFVNISTGDGGDIRLEDLRSLFPNLIVLGITQSPYTAASLINLQGTRTASRWEVSMSLAPKSLLQDPHFARRLNLNYFSSLVQKPTATSLGGSRGQRALISPLISTTTASTSSTSASGIDVVGEESYESNDIPLSDSPSEDQSNNLADNGNNTEVEETVQNDAGIPEVPQPLRRLVWPSVRHLNISWNELTSDALPDFLSNTFPNLEQIDLSNNFLTKLDKVRDADWPKLESIDISGNPLDCINLDWIESAKIKLLHPNQTLCDQPPHQNKAKPIFSVLHLLKKVREGCRVNCSCDIAYIWEQNHVIFSKTVVNCSGKGFLDFPDPDQLPQPTDTLDLRNNNITSMSTFVDDHRYLNLHVMNLYLDDNQISSINLLEGSDWFYHFQVFSIRRNDLTEVPVYVLENVFRQNKRLLQIDLSSNKFKCECSTVSSFKVWLLKYSNQIGNIEDVQCDSTKEQIRYMKLEEWCKVDNGTELLNILDMISIVLALLIIAVIAKVYYDYYNFKTKGRLPWIVSKM